MSVCLQIQCAAGQIPGPNLPIADDIAKQGVSGAEAADPQGEVHTAEEHWDLLAPVVIGW